MKRTIVDASALELTEKVVAIKRVTTVSYTHLDVYKRQLTSRVNENKFIVVDDIKMNEIKTKTFKNMLDCLKVNKALVILNDNDKNVVMSARNIEGVKTALTNTINVYDILKYNTVAVSYTHLAYSYL